MARCQRTREDRCFRRQLLNQARCPDCGGTGELRIDSENINEHFEVEKQTVITPVRAAMARASWPRVKIGAHGPADSRTQERERHPGYDTANYPGRFHGPLEAA